MTRDFSSWSDDLAAEAQAAGLEDLMAPLSAREFFRLELGLYFLTQYMPGQPVTDLRHLLDRYIAPPEGTESSVRWPRHRLNKSARSGQWRLRLNEYSKVPAHLRLFEPADADAQRVVNSTVFRRRSSSHLPGREATYRAALASPVGYTPQTLHEPAPVGADLLFPRTDGSRTRFRFPNWVERPEEEALLRPRASRRRRPFSVTRDDLAQAAKEMDQLLRDDPRHRDDDYCGQLEKTVFARIDETAGTVSEGLGIFGIDGVAHVVGLMNSGKTTFNDILVKVAVGRGLRVGYLVASVGDALAKVRFFRSLGIRAGPPDRRLPLRGACRPLIGRPALRSRRPGVGSGRKMTPQASSSLMCASWNNW
ncbi:pPIWI_RE_Z domain-containing protein [Streptomyces jumonjinensis]|uniref:pPIWI_RE_Z domain-containing protein n=1 Tax=Streptomyces jumonjinensis TaxID=1945 RepID=UPI0037A20E42